MGTEPLAQQLVVYSQDGRERAYSTAYTGEQARAATKRCERRHPRASVRVVSAKSWRPTPGE